MARVVAIIAHPDDELFAGGMLAKYAAEGNELIIVSVTRGEGGEVGEPPLCAKEALGPFRENEMRCSARAIGASDVIFLGYLDSWIEVGEEGKAIDVPIEECAAVIASQLATLKPDVIMTHGTDGEYGHPQHIYTHRAVMMAVKSLAPWRPKDLLTWMANAGQPADDRLVNWSDPADFALDITPWFEAKAAAVECHRTQHAMILRNSKAPSVRDALRRLEAFRRWE